ncbi:MAG: YdcF family protein [Candidatus Nanoarchaeia archaeon]
MTISSELKEDTEYNNKKGVEEILDAIIVLGAGRFSIGNYSRVKEAAKYNHDIPIILTGGRGLLCNGMKETEAQIMKKQLVELLGEESKKIAINLETNARNTRENFSKSKELLYLMPEVKTIGVVTNPAHMKRAMDYAKEELPEYNFIALPVTPKGLDIKTRIANSLCSLYEKFKVYRIAYRKR